MLIHEEEPLTQLVTSSGSASFNTIKFSGVKLSLIYVKFDTDKTTFDLRMTDRNDRDIYHNKGLESPYREQIAIPLKGIYTVRVQNASNDENVDVMLSATEGD